MTSWKYIMYRAGGDSRWQRVDVIAWTEHGAIVRATEPGTLPEDQPSLVPLSDLFVDDNPEGVRA